MEPWKIYFGMSIDGGRSGEDCTKVLKFMDYIEDNYEASILTRHFADKELSDKEGAAKKTYGNIFDENKINLLKESNMFIADFSNTSSGLGVELGLTIAPLVYSCMGRIPEEYAYRKPTLIIYKPLNDGRKLSAEIQGIVESEIIKGMNSHISIRPYESLKEGYLHIDEFFQGLSVESLKL